ncbi:hypothetical protein [Photobacterium alginatilyticum]|uniref:Uncharacterized protein n=1 Tax=Photobacterium alginatilyticum TaxID=1775171 RepID=A0ABW9YE51_9GAMM|nr:hypothetical protein [Photobacterium alginatilyticum]NBI51883.1 hypothetical protein [Photobacterium alginatilyticum]
MNENLSLNLIAALEIKRENELKFKEMSNLIFPPLARETGWTLTSLWINPEDNSLCLKVQNQWQTNSESTAVVESELNKAMEKLIQTLPNYQQNLEMLDTLIDQESIYYATSYTS